MPSSPLICNNSCIKLCGCIQIHVDIEGVGNPLVPVERVAESPFSCHTLHNNARSELPVAIFDSQELKIYLLHWLLSHNLHSPAGVYEFGHGVCFKCYTVAVFLLDTLHYWIDDGFQCVSSSRIANCDKICVHSGFVVLIGRDCTAWNAQITLYSKK